MKTVIFYGRTQVGTVVLSYLVAKGFRVKVIPEDDMTRELIKIYKLEEVTFDTMGEFDLFVCCHGKKIIKPQYLKLGTFINMHSCLWKYKGKDPISRYIDHHDTDASIESHYMVEEVDAGEVIERVLFQTPVVNTHAEYFNLALPHYYECIDKTLKKIGWLKSAAMTRYGGSSLPPEKKIKSESLLRIWATYYSKYFDDLYVVGCHTNNGEIGEIIRQFNLKYEDIPYDIYSSQAHQHIFEKQEKLLKENEWVFYSDLDEIVVPDPDIYRDLGDFMTRCSKNQTFCEGYELLKSEEDGPLDSFKPILQQRSKWCKDQSGSYNKPCLSRVKTNWREGFHSVNEMEADKAKTIENTGLYLFHLKNVESIEAPDHCFRDHKVDIINVPDKFRRSF